MRWMSFRPAAVRWCGSSLPRTAFRWAWRVPAPTAPVLEASRSLRRQPGAYLGSRLSKPQWTTSRSVARAGHLRELEALAGQGVRDVVIHPIGFLSDHMKSGTPGHREPGEGRGAGAHAGPGEDGGNGAGIRRDAPRADPGTTGGATRTSRARHPRPESSVCPASGLLPWPDTRRRWAPEHRWVSR